MKKTIMFAALVALLLTSCADNKTINGIKYRPYGFFNAKTAKNPNIEYEVSGYAVFSGIVFSEFLFIPTIYTFGYNLFEPVGTISKNTNDNGVIGELKITDNYTIVDLGNGYIQVKPIDETKKIK